MIAASHLKNLLDDHAKIVKAYHEAGAEVAQIEKLIYSFITVCRQENYSLIVISFLDAVYGE